MITNSPSPKNFYQETNWCFLRVPFFFVLLTSLTKLTLRLLILGWEFLKKFPTAVFVFWLKIIVFDKSEPKVYERIALLISMIWITTIACLSYTFNLVFFTSIEPFLWTIQVFYLVGILISTVIFIHQFLKLKGITIKKVKKEIRERRAVDNKTE